MKLTVISVGKKHDRTLESAISDFEKRLKSPFSFEWRFLPNSNFEGEKARVEESIRLEKLLVRDDFVILLDERGKNLSSPEFSQLLSEKLPVKKCQNRDRWRVWRFGRISKTGGFCMEFFEIGVSAPDCAVDFDRANLPRARDHQRWKISSRITKAARERLNFVVSSLPTSCHRLETSSFFCGFLGCRLL